MGFDIHLYLLSSDRIRKERDQLEKDFDENKFHNRQEITDAVERISKLNRELEDRMS